MYNVKTGWSTVKIRGSLEEDIEDTLEVLINDHGKDDSNIIIGVVPVSKEIPNLSNPGKIFFGFTRDGELLQNGSIMEGGTKGYSAGIFMKGDKIKFNLNPTTGYFKITFNEEDRLPGRLNIKEPVCFALALQHLTQKVQILN